LPTPPGTHPLFALLLDLQIPSPLIGLIIAGFIAAILSTADELLNCCGYAVLADFLNLPRSVSRPELTVQYIRSGKFYTGLFAFLAAGLAVLTISFGRQITDVATVAFSTQVVFTFPILLALYSKNARRWQRVALVSMLVSFAASLSLVLTAWSLGGLDSQTLVDSAPLFAFILSAAVVLTAFVFQKRRLRRATIPSPPETGNQ